MISYHEAYHAKFCLHFFFLLGYMFCLSHPSWVNHPGNLKWKCFSECSFFHWPNSDSVIIISCPSYPHLQKLLYQNSVHTCFSCPCYMRAHHLTILLSVQFPPFPCLSIFLMLKYLQFTVCFLCLVVASHSVKCSACKVYPIVGLRYQCLDCLRYNLCQTCFFLGRISKKHKLRHPVQEHCYEARVTTWLWMLN
jgi:hypothetical protein